MRTQPFVSRLRHGSSIEFVDIISVFGLQGPVVFSQFNLREAGQGGRTSGGSDPMITKQNVPLLSLPNWHEGVRASRRVALDNQPQLVRLSMRFDRLVDDFSELFPPVSRQ